MSGARTSLRLACSSGWSSPTATGSPSFTVRAVYEDSGLAGDYLITRAAWAPNHVQDSDALVAVAFRDGVSPDDGEAAVRKVAEAYGGPERTRELGLLHAVGQTRAQLRAMVRWESLLVAAFGTLGGLGLGGFLGWALVKASDSAGTSAFAVPPAQLAVVLLLGLVAGALAGWRPARRAARPDVLRAIATE